MPAKVRRMFAVESNMVHKIGYDPATPGIEHGYLVVQFSNLDAYAYENVPYTVFVNLLNAVSVGEFFNKHVKTEYKGVKISSERGDAPTAAKKPNNDVPMLDVMGAPEAKTTSARRKK